jgi:hypothetical protein
MKNQDERKKRFSFRETGPLYPVIVLFDTSYPSTGSLTLSMIENNMATMLELVIVLIAEEDPVCIRPLEGSGKDPPWCLTNQETMVMSNLFYSSTNSILHLSYKKSHSFGSMPNVTMVLVCQ